MESLEKQESRGGKKHLLSTYHMPDPVFLACHAFISHEATHGGRYKELGSHFSVSHLSNTCLPRDSSLWIWILVFPWNISMVQQWGFLFFFFNFFGHKACEILVLHPRSEPRPPALEAESYPLYSREIPHQCVLNYFILQGHWGFPDGSASKEPTRQCRGCKEMQVQSLDWEDPLEGMATHSRILAGKIPWTESMVGNSL